MKLLNVVGARPNLLKMAALMEAYRPHRDIEPILVHTGQHYDRALSQLFFEELGIPEPSINLGVGSASHAVQTAEIMRTFEPILLETNPDAVVVVGDVNSTIACGLVAVKLGVRLVHVEAGLRSFDRSMPEEINRILTDAISDLHFCTEPSGVENLLREGADEETVHLVGNLMIDTLLRNRERADASRVLDTCSVDAGNYVVVTLHRPSNVDRDDIFKNLLDAIGSMQEVMPVVFPIHPRTLAKAHEFGLGDRIERLDNLRLVEPLGYLDFVKLMANARVVVTDSGGVQEETTILDVPCLTLRDNTERPITVELGTNRLVGTEAEVVLEGFHSTLATPRVTRERPPYWDGLAGSRVAEVLREWL